MEQFQVNIEDVIKKWEKYHVPSTSSISSDAEWYKVPLQASNTPIVRRKKRRPWLQKDATNEIVQVKKKFRLVPPELKIESQEYELKWCRQCQSTLQYISPTYQQITKNKSIDIEECSSMLRQIRKKVTRVAAYSGFVHKIVRFSTSYVIKKLHQMFLCICMESKDVDYLNQLSEHPVIFVHDSVDILNICLIYLCLVGSTGKVPYTAIPAETVSSTVLRYLMKKLRFVFISSTGEHKDIVEELFYLLHNKDSLLLPNHSYHENKSIDGIFHSVLQCFREQDTMNAGTLIVPVSVALEKPSTRTSGVTFFQLVLHSFSNRKYGLAHFSISKAAKLKSFLRVVKEMNPQETANEENSLISRHLRYNILESVVLLPSHLLAYLFVVQLREGLVLPKLIQSMNVLIEQLNEMDCFMGFKGDVEAITWHAVSVLSQQDLVTYDKETSFVEARLQDHLKATQLFQLAVKVIHFFVPKAIIATSIISCLGGKQTLNHGNGSAITCNRTQVLETAEMLSELLSYLLEFYCPFTITNELLSNSLEMYVTQDVLRTTETTYQNQRHAKLVQSITMSSCWDDEEVWGGGSSESSYFYSIDLDGATTELLVNSSNCIIAFIEMSFILLATVRKLPNDKHFSIDQLYEEILKRFKVGHFLYGEVIIHAFVLRFCEYLFEKEMIDDVEDFFVVSSQQNAEFEMLELLQKLSTFR